MKAAVIQQFGDVPQCIDFPEPIAGEGETLINIKASVLENFDKMVAAGIHYSSKQLFPAFPAITGHSGIGTTADGRLVGFGMPRAPYGAFAEKTVASRVMPVPDDVDPIVAACVPASVLTSYLPLIHSAKFQAGETVLVNGATGVSGKIAVQLAKLLGAKRVIATGRNYNSLQLLKTLGADVVIDLKQTDDKVLADIQDAKADTGIDVVIDFIWGRPAEIIMQSFVPTKIGFPGKRVRYVHIGEKAGSMVSLSGEMLRTSGLELYGASNIPHEAIPQALEQVWEWIRENKFYVNIEVVPLADIVKAWQRTDLEGKRLVVVP